MRTYISEKWVQLRLQIFRCPSRLESQKIWIKYGNSIRMRPVNLNFWPEFTLNIPHSLKRFLEWEWNVTQQCFLSCLVWFLWENKLLKLVMSYIFSLACMPHSSCIYQYYHFCTKHPTTPPSKLIVRLSMFFNFGHLSILVRGTEGYSAFLMQMSGVKKLQVYTSADYKIAKK